MAIYSIEVRDIKIDFTFLGSIHCKYYIFKTPFFSIPCMKNKHLVILITIFCSLSFSDLSAQEVFDDIAYIPAPIEHQGTNTPKINELASSAFEAIKNRHNKDAQEAFDAIIALDKYNVQGLYGLAYSRPRLPSIVPTFVHRHPASLYGSNVGTDFATTQ